MSPIFYWHRISNVVREFINNNFNFKTLKIMALMKYNDKLGFPSILDDFFTNDWFFDFSPKTGLKNYTPLGDVIENEDSFNVELMLPGLDKKDIKMEVDNGVLTIEAERKKSEKNKYNRVESYFGKYVKTYTLPEYVDHDNINAKYENGVLKVTIPKTEEKVSTKLIEIE
jgi:HSP20 family protein